MSPERRSPADDEPLDVRPLPPLQVLPEVGVHYLCPSCLRCVECGQHHHPQCPVLIPEGEARALDGNR